MAKSLDALAEVKQSNAVLESAIDAYLSVLTQASKVPGALLIQAAQRCIDRGRFKGELSHQFQRALSDCVRLS